MEEDELYLPRTQMQQRPVVCKLWVEELRAKSDEVISRLGSRRMHA